MAYDNNLTGLLSRNDRKRPDKKDPDFNGACEIDGKHFWISGWIKESGPQSKTPGRKLFSLSFKPKEASAQSQAAAKPAETPAARPNQNLDEDVPF